MEKKIQKDSWLRKIRTLAVVGVMAVVGAGSAWGQSYTILYKNESRQTNIPERLDTVYIPDDESRELYVPEMRNNDGRTNINPDYQWYVRWYRADDSGNPIPISGKFKTTDVDLRGDKIIEGGTAAQRVHKGALHDTPEGTSLFWYRAFYTDATEGGAAISSATGASTILYTRKANDQKDVVICDVSMNADEKLNAEKTHLTEPTLSKRYKFVILPASQIADKIERANGKGIEHYEISCPANAAGINVQMKTFPSNYCWKEGSSIVSGVKFAYKIDDGFLVDLKDDKQVIGVGSISSRTVVSVYAKSGSYTSDLLATFTLIPQENAAFMLEDKVKTSTDPRRNPEKRDDLYERIGSADFDMDNDIPIGDLSSSNNLCPDPIGSELTTYAFFKPTTTIRAKQKYSPLQNQYGLYRSANVKGVSEDDGKAGKDYFWFFLYHGHYSPDLYAYDRTYANTGGQKCGYFFYTDASNEPGRLVKLELDNVICQYTELTVTAWVNDMTTWEEKKEEGKPLPPNININFIGKTASGEEIVLHRFTSGDALTDYTGTYNSLPANNNVGKWQQLCYTFSISSDQTGYDKYYLEVQNNTAHTYGADYAIDDVRVYKSKPNIKVNRENNCDASTLIVGTDHATILRNMGWKADEYVASDEDFHTDPDYLKYRYGLMGAEDQYRNSRVGNVYFAFLSEDKSTWMTVNDLATGLSDKAAKSLRVAVPTRLSTEAYEFYTTDKETALRNEQKMNIRAVEDYNKDYNEIWSKIEGHSGGTIDISGVGDPDITTGEKAFNEEKYQEALVELFARRLKIPRLRCPWYENGVLKLAVIDVNNTDLKYRGQGGASGKYWVVTFSAEQVAGTGGGEGVIDANGKCTLMSEFTVEPATTVLIDAKSPGDPEIAVCVGTVHQIQAYLNFYDKDTDKPIDESLTDDYEYIFDWYLGPMEEYIEETVDGLSIKDVLENYRDSHSFTLDPITKDEVEAWSETNQKNFLLRLMNANKLLLGTPANEPFDMPVNTERMVAMPYLTDVQAGQITYAFCDAETEVNLEAVEDPIPQMHQGFVNVSYPADVEVALRLGWPNMNSTTLDLPIYKVENMASNADHLELGGTSVDIYMDDITIQEPIGTATALNIPKPTKEGNILDNTGKLTFSLNEKAKKYLLEGQDYVLLIPFAQFDGSTQLNSVCDGLLRLPVKIVPEYQTWKGEANAVWYVDSHWNQSTKRELHEGTVDDTDAHNGTDVITNVYSPLYFTNITILGDSVSTNSELKLEGDKGTVSKDGGVLNLGTNYDIQYDLAVNTDENDDEVITSYYINKVKEVYFKPGATLLNQHLLTYTKAHVEFMMKQSKAYWMASPLQDVYAGDMYAPTKRGKQRTPVFGEDGKITYSEQLNDRWNPAFYQKAWSKTVWYMDKNNAEVEAPLVESNWNIEYNDVWVPYEIGKGFYARVEEQPVLVRLPKDDEDYKYYVTKALSEKPQERPKAGQLAELNEADGSMTLDLSIVDNDGAHFLVGNPYMAYLKMGGDDGFLAVNKDVLAQKYWTVDGKDGIIVGTPDVTWPTGSELSSGYIAPMQAFFVEKKGYTPTKADEPTDETKMEVTFSADMTVSATKVSSASDTKSFSAVNPVLTLTATSKQGQSRAAVVQKSDASNQYEADKDAVALLDSELDAPMAYTVAGSYAAAVNAIHDYKNVPLGVYAKDGEEVELSIEGASQLVSPLYLYDAVTRSTTPIDGDSFTLNLTGSSHGRYFLTTDEGIKAEGDIRIYSPADGQLIIASTPSDRLKQVQVYDLNGRMVESRQNVGTATCQLYVAGGIYIVRVQSEQGEAQAKLKIK